MILDLFWRRPTELLLRIIVPTEVGFAGRPIRMVQIGRSAGPDIALVAEALRTPGLERTGAEGSLTIDVDRVPLEDVSGAWSRPTEGRRIVTVPS